ncbi:hypothetical protein ACIBJD_36915 [Kitasatospora sp. NPDC050467]|uniref:WXG100-like domain-containing protein n=1 Tax=Kitasatospora sp. NPDC050467 TaxID=3364053 RepID=UPI0037A71BF4
MIELPADLAEVLKTVQSSPNGSGIAFPNTDEGQLAELAAAWEAWNTAADPRVRAIVASAQQAMAHMSGAAADNFRQYLEKYAGRDDAHAVTTLEAGLTMAQCLRGASDTVTQAKTAMVQQLRAAKEYLDTGLPGALPEVAARSEGVRKTADLCRQHTGQVGADVDSMLRQSAGQVERTTDAGKVCLLGGVGTAYSTTAASGVDGPADAAAGGASAVAARPVLAGLGGPGTLRSEFASAQVPGATVCRPGAGAMPGLNLAGLSGTATGEGTGAGVPGASGGGAGDVSGAGVPASGSPGADARAGGGAHGGGGAGGGGPRAGAHSFRGAGAFGGASGASGASAIAGAAGAAGAAARAGMVGQTVGARSTWQTVAPGAGQGAGAKAAPGAGAAGRTGTGGAPGGGRGPAGMGGAHGKGKRGAGRGSARFRGFGQAIPEDEDEILTDSGIQGLAARAPVGDREAERARRRWLDEVRADAADRRHPTADAAPAAVQEERPAAATGDLLTQLTSAVLGPQAVVGGPGGGSGASAGSPGGGSGERSAEAAHLDQVQAAAGRGRGELEPGAGAAGSAKASDGAAAAGKRAPIREEGGYRVPSPTLRAALAKLAASGELDKPLPPGSPAPGSAPAAAAGDAPRP